MEAGEPRPSAQTRSGRRENSENRPVPGLDFVTLPQPAMLVSAVTQRLLPIALLLVLPTTACAPGTATSDTAADEASDGDGDGDELLGGMQKGPFLLGSSVTVQELDAFGQPTGVDFATETDGVGAYTLPGVGSSLVEVSGDGFHYNEVLGELSSAPIVLRALAPADGDPVYVNVVTHLSFLRIRHLLVEGTEFADARIQAESEVREALGLTAEGYELTKSASQMNMLGGDNTDNAFSLAASAVILQAAISEVGADGPVDAAAQQLANTIALDLEDDGELNADTTQELVAAQQTLDVAAITEAFQTYLDDNAVGEVAPNIGRIVDVDLDGLANASDNCPYDPNPEQEDSDDDGIGDACSCGNGKVDAGEECDDGNATDGDGCSTLCTVDGGLQVSADELSSCVRTEDGEVFCFGNAQNNWLGYGNEEHVGDDELPQDVGPLNIGFPVDRVEVGRPLCGWSENDVKCWGPYPGYPNVQFFEDDETPADFGLLDLGGLQVATIESGFGCSFILTTDGELYAWGSNFRGGCGLASNSTWIEVPTGPLATGGPVEKISVGGTHACALREDGEVLCWGEAGAHLGYGLRDEHIGDDEHPADVGPVETGGSVVGIEAGVSVTCALFDDDSVRCWGANMVALGRGTLDPVSPLAGADNGEAGACGNGLINLEETCDDGNLVANDGCDEFCRLEFPGIGDDEPASEAPALNIGPGTVRKLSAGRSVCALLDGGQVKCWGLGEWGDLGYGNLEPVGDDETPAGVGFVELGGPATDITSGGYHHCVSLAEGTARCWGLNNRGQLGLGHTDTIGDDEVPTAAPALEFP